MRGAELRYRLHGIIETAEPGDTTGRASDAVLASGFSERIRREMVEEMAEERPFDDDEPTSDRGDA